MCRFKNGATARRCPHPMCSAGAATEDTTGLLAVLASDGSVLALAMRNNGKSTETPPSVTKGYLVTLPFYCSLFFPFPLLFSSLPSSFFFSLCVSPPLRGSAHERQGRRTPCWPPVRGHIFSATARWVRSSLFLSFSVFSTLLFASYAVRFLAPGLRLPVRAHSSPHTISPVSIHLITYRLVSLRAIYRWKAEVDVRSGQFKKSAILWERYPSSPLGPLPSFTAASALS